MVQITSGKLNFVFMCILYWPVNCTHELMIHLFKMRVKFIVINFLFITWQSNHKPDILKGLCIKVVAVADESLFSTTELLLSCTWNYFVFIFCFSSWYRTLILFSRRNYHSIAVKLLCNGKTILQIWSYVKAQQARWILLNPLTRKCDSDASSSWKISYCVQTLYT